VRLPLGDLLRETQRVREVCDARTTDTGTNDFGAQRLRDAEHGQVRGMLERRDIDVRDLAPDDHIVGIDINRVLDDVAPGVRHTAGPAFSF
jgi:hypothetical protein